MNEDYIRDIIRKYFPNFSNCDDAADEIWKYVNHNYVKWHEVIPNQLPEGEVLAGDFAPGTIGFKELLVGWLKEEGGIVYCDNDNDFLNSVTHYIPIHDIDIYINRLP